MLKAWRGVGAGTTQSSVEFCWALSSARVVSVKYGYVAHALPIALCGVLIMSYTTYRKITVATTLISEPIELT
jgi:hypothetical protein